MIFNLMENIHLFITMLKAFSRLKKIVLEKNIHSIFHILLILGVIKTKYNNKNKNMKKSKIKKFIMT